MQVLHKLTRLLIAEVISTHPIVGNMAVACGCTNVINLIFDNYPQPAGTEMPMLVSFVSLVLPDRVLRYFVLVPGALNLVQSPSYFDKLLDMGCPAKSLRLAGHWVSSDLCLNAIPDSKARIERSERNLPRRFLIAVGGAGAQSAFLAGLLAGIAPLLRDKRIRIYLNCGDHKHIADAVIAKLRSLELEWDEVTTSEGTVALCQREALDFLQEPENWKERRTASERVGTGRIESDRVRFLCSFFGILMNAALRGIRGGRQKQQVGASFVAGVFFWSDGCGNNMGISWTRPLKRCKVSQCRKTAFQGVTEI